MQKQVGDTQSNRRPLAALLSRPWMAWLMLLCILLPALLFGLNQRPVYKIQEVRIAETAREMHASGDYVVPRLNGQLRLQKPPLPYWFTAASYHAFGVSAMAARLPSVMFTLATACLLFAWLRSAGQLSAAISAALVLVTSFIALRYGRSAEADASLMFFISAASYLGYRMLHESRSTVLSCLFYLALGLAFLCKGPAGLAIPLLSTVITAITMKRGKALAGLASIPGLLLLAIFAFGWYGWILWKMPKLAQQFLGKQLDETFISGNHMQPLWWYLQHICEFFLPWGVLLFPALWWAYKFRPWPPLLRFAMVWLAVVFVLLTATVNKQVQYALLFAPPLAMVLGYYLSLAEGKFASFNRIVLYLCMAGLAVAIGYTLYRLPEWSWSMLVPPLVLLVPLLAVTRQNLLGLNSPWLGYRHPVLVVALLTSLLYCYGELSASSDEKKTDAPLLIAQLKPDLDNIYQLKPADGALSFYAERVIAPISTDDIPALLEKYQSIRVIDKQAPQMPGIQAVAEHSAGVLTVWRLTRQ